MTGDSGLCLHANIVLPLPSILDLTRQYKLMQSQLMAKILDLQESCRVLTDQRGGQSIPALSFRPQV
jgi:hypothetical protein